MLLVIRKSLDKRYWSLVIGSSNQSRNWMVLFFHRHKVQYSVQYEQY